jgi:hypothetical protein
MEDILTTTSMRMRRLLVVFATPALLAALVPFASAQTNGAAERFTAIAVNLGVEDYASQPVMLHDIRREPISR